MRLSTVLFRIVATAAIMWLPAIIIWNAAKLYYGHRLGIDWQHFFQIRAPNFAKLTSQDIADWISDVTYAFGSAYTVVILVWRKRRDKGAAGDA